MCEGGREGGREGERNHAWKSSRAGPWPQATYIFQPVERVLQGCVQHAAGPLLVMDAGVL